MYCDVIAGLPPGKIDLSRALDFAEEELHGGADSDLSRSIFYTALASSMERAGFEYARGD